MIFRRTDRKLTVADRHRLVARAAELHLGGNTRAEVEAAMQAGGAPPGEARTISLEGRRKAEDRLLSAATLPPSAGGPVNYYFALGVTPGSSLDEIHRFYRMKAREVHPDRHQGELTPDRWGELMRLIGDAHQVLSDTASRRAYDVVWQRRSRQLTETFGNRAERRGDWRTRLLWYLAEIGSLEERIAAALATVARREDDEERRRAGLALAALGEDYEDHLSHVRLEAYGVPEPFTALAEQVRAELARKQRLVEPLRDLGARLGGGSDAMSAGLVLVADALRRVRRAHHHFDLRVAEELPAAIQA